MTVDDTISRALTSTPAPVPPPLERIGRRARTLRRRRRAGQAAGGVAVLAGVVAVALPFLPGGAPEGSGVGPAAVPADTEPAVTESGLPSLPPLIEVRPDELRDQAGMDAVIARLRDRGIAAVRQDPACSYRPEVLGPDAVGDAVDLTRDADTALAIEPALIPDGVTVLVALSGPTVRTSGPDAGGVGYGIGVNAIRSLPNGELPLCITDPLPW